MDIEIDYVLSVSSEDESSPASNLTMGRRWTVAEKGISEATVDLKFKKSSIIKSISIGKVGPIFFMHTLEIFRPIRLQAAKVILRKIKCQPYL